MNRMNSYSKNNISWFNVNFYYKITPNLNSNMNSEFGFHNEFQSKFQFVIIIK